MLSLNTINHLMDSNLNIKLIIDKEISFEINI